jgi:hypothetical protein
MTEPNITTTVERLHTQSPCRIWGLSAESVYTALAARVAEEPLEKRLRSHTRAETLLTNDTRELADVVESHEWILEELGFYTGTDLTLLGALVLTSAQPRPLIRASIVSQIKASETILRSCRDSEGLLPWSEFDSMLAEEWDETVLGPLLASLGFVTLHPDSVDPDLEIITAALDAQRAATEDGALAIAYEHTVPHIAGINEETCIADLVTQLVDIPSTSPSLPQACATLAARGAPVLGEVDFTSAIADQGEEYKTAYETVRELLSLTSENRANHVETEGTIDVEDLDEHITLDDEERNLLSAIVATIRMHPELSNFDLTFLSDRLSTSPYEAYQFLSRVPGVEAETSEEDVLRFKTVPEDSIGDDIRDEYIEHLIERCASIRHQLDTLDDASITDQPSASSADEMIAAAYEGLEDGDVAPTYFTYTLLDPEALGEQKMNQYVGDSRELGHERARLWRWHETRPTGLESYTEMTDQLFSLGLERDLEDKVLRIMTPFDDDTFNAYVSNIRRLLDDGYELRLLTRHTKEPYEWRRLQKNLLSAIKTHRERVTVRTYSRFKQHQRVTSDMDFRKLGEVGIHGKLQTIGAPEEGASLLGSANFMTNSFDWNPECGIYTERTFFVAAAIEFFDIVWEISAADELDVERLQEVPNQKLVPSYYS